MSRSADALTLTGDYRSATDRAQRAPGPDYSGLGTAGDAVLATPPGRMHTEEERLETARLDAIQDRSASLGMASLSLRYGGCGGPGPGWVPSKVWVRAHPGVPAESVGRCESPDHKKHLDAALDDLRALRLAVDPECGNAKTALGFRKTELKEPGAKQ